MRYKSKEALKAWNEKAIDPITAKEYPEFKRFLELNKRTSGKQRFVVMKATESTDGATHNIYF